SWRARRATSATTRASRRTPSAWWSGSWPGAPPRRTGTGPASPPSGWAPPPSWPRRSPPASSTSGPTTCARSSPPPCGPACRSPTRDTWRPPTRDRARDRLSATVNFDLPPDLVAYLDELDEFIEREIKPLEEQDDNIRFFDHRREHARTDWDR